MTICIVSGARPQFVKVAPLIRVFNEVDLEVYHIHTGQHYDHEMSKSFFEDLQIPPPQSNLGVGSGSHAVQTAKMMEGLEKEFVKVQPDCVIVIGDTNSTLAAGVTAVKMNIPVVHLEAGMRSHDWSMPEEINRIVVDRISSFLITSTKEAVHNLLAEGYQRDKILLTGDIMVDSLYFANSQEVTFSFSPPEDYFLATLHRQANVDNKEKLQNAMQIFQDAPLPVLLPLHPRTKQRIEDFDLPSLDDYYDNIVVLPPLGYLEFIKLQANATGIITDSGGIQKEAFILKVPCVTLRSTTEWIESIELGANKLLDVDYDMVIKAMHEMVNGTFVVTQDHPYGKGDAAKIIVNEISTRLRQGLIKVDPNIAYPDNIQ